MFFVDWETHASDVVAVLRAEAGRDPYDRQLSDLIGMLSTRSEEFRVRWVDRNVKLHRAGTKHLDHPIVVDLALGYEALDLAARRWPAAPRVRRRTAAPDPRASAP